MIIYQRPHRQARHIHTGAKLHAAADAVFLSSTFLKQLQARRSTVPQSEDRGHKSQLQATIHDRDRDSGFYSLPTLRVNRCGSGPGHHVVIQPYIIRMDETATTIQEGFESREGSCYSIQILATWQG